MILVVCIFHDYKSVCSFMKVCIIDDEWISRFLIQKLIQKTVTDPEIINFANGREAFEFIKLHQTDRLSLPELILLDINMPVANGWEFLDMMQALHIKNYNPLIYMVSSSIDPADLARAKTYPEVQGFLAKPLTYVMIAPVLEAALLITTSITGPLGTIKSVTS